MITAIVSTGECGTYRAHYRHLGARSGAVRANEPVIDVELLLDGNENCRRRFAEVPLRMGALQALSGSGTCRLPEVQRSAMPATPISDTCRPTPDTSGQGAFPTFPTLSATTLERYQSPANPTLNG